MVTAAQALWWIARFAVTAGTDAAAGVAAFVTLAVTLLLVPYARHNLSELRQRRSEVEYRTTSQ